MPKLTKKDLARRLGARFVLPPDVLLDLVDATLAEISSCMVRRDVVEFRGFGIFETQVTKPRVGRNMKNPTESIHIPPRTIVKFRAGKGLRDRLNKKNIPRLTGPEI
jgi:nucleoid DNA-binding protein